MSFPTLRELKHKLEQLQERWRRARRENEQLRRQNRQLEREREQLKQQQERLERERERLREENDKLRQQLEEAQRANKRQAAPFSRGTRKEHPKTPGRKPGAAYGQRHCKRPPKQVDEVIPVPLPEQCSCGGKVTFDRIEFQYQHEIVQKTIWRRFDIAIGHCEKCQKRVQGRDPRQTSDALGAAKVQLGPEALALAVRMKTGAATAPQEELVARPCSPAFCKRPSSKAKSPSMFCWNYSVAGTSVRFSIWCQGPKKPLRIPRARRRRTRDPCHRSPRGPFRGSS